MRPVALGERLDGSGERFRRIAIRIASRMAAAGTVD
jgi:hypothetical protein